MAKGQKVSTRELKEEAVRQARTSGKPMTQVAREVGLCDPSIHQWRTELPQHGAAAFPGRGHQTVLEEEKVASKPGASARPVGAKEKRLTSLPQFGRSFSPIARSTEVRAFMLSSKSKESIARKRIARLMREHGLTAKRNR